MVRTIVVVLRAFRFLIGSEAAKGIVRENSRSGCFPGRQLSGASAKREIFSGGLGPLQIGPDF